jgi:hypothetical protein
VEEVKIGKQAPNLPKTGSFMHLTSKIAENSFFLLKSTLKDILLR